MNNRSILSGKGTLVDLENLHGKVTKVYSRAMDGVFDAIEKSDELQQKYQEDVKDAEDAGEDINDIIKPVEFKIDKSVLDLLNSAKGFLKENDVQMDITKKAGVKKLRGMIKTQIQEKTN